MGGRGGGSGILTTSRLTGVKTEPKVFKGMVSDEANFILRELHQDKALQNIIKKSFRGGTVEIMIDGEQLEKVVEANEVIVFVDRHGKELSARLANYKSTQTTAVKKRQDWHNYDTARAKEQATTQAIKTLDDLKRRLKK